MGVFVCAPDFFFSQFNLPNRPWLVAITVAVALTTYAAPSRAQLVINELYYDHPGSDDGHEFVEIMNVSDAVVPLAGVTLQFHNGSGVGWEVLWSGPGGDLSPGDLFLVGGRYVSPVPDDVAAFSVQNGPDAVRLVVAGVPSDLLAYGSLDDGLYAEGRSAPGVDAGRSLARLPDGHDSDDNAADFAEADPTPGSYNVARYDAAVTVAGATRAAAVLDERGLERIELLASNRGKHDIAPAAATVAMWDSTWAGSSLLARTSNAGAISPGSGEAFAFSVALAPGYHWLPVVVTYEADERSHNDRLTLLRRVGGPRLLVSEILCYPADGCPQFVELYNPGNAPVDIAGYQLRDKSHALTTITAAAVSIPAGGYLAVTPDVDALRGCYPDAPSERLLQHGGAWPTLNRTGSAGVSDSVVVTDALSLPVDVVGYPPVGSEYSGRSLERVDLYAGRKTQTWVLSPDPPGASPGRPSGRALLRPPAPGSLEVTPRTFSPWSGETMTISVDAPPGTRAALSVYDVEGRRLAELGAAIAFPAVFVWDGRHTGGSRMVPGLYVVVCESFSAAGERMATRKVVVGCARRRG